MADITKDEAVQLVNAFEDLVAVRAARKVLRLFQLMKMGFNEHEALERLFGDDGTD